jgi:hypothetical protein
VTSFDSGVVFTPDDDTLALHAIAVDGPFMNDLSRITIPVGERLTGWAAAHRTSVWNSDAALDLGPDLTRGQLVLASAVSLTVSTHLIGVLTLYGRSGQHITLADRVCLEAAAALIAAELADSQRFEPRCIDGRRAEVRSAIFPVIEAALSNDGTGKPLFSVVGLRFDAIRRDDGRRLYEFDYEAAVQQLLRVGLKQQRARYALVLSSGTVLLIADTSAAEPLQATLEGMTQKEPFQQLTLRTSRIRDAFELQMFARSAVEPPSSALSASHDGPSVH